MTNQKQELPMAPCLLTDRDALSHHYTIIYRGPSIDASYQVSVHLAKWFQRRRLKCEKLTNNGRQVMAKVPLPLERRANKWIHNAKYDTAKC